MALYFGFGERFSTFSLRLAMGPDDGYESIQGQAAEEGFALLLRLADPYSDTHYDVAELDQLTQEIDSVLSRNNDIHAHDFAGRLRGLVDEAKEQQQALYVYSD